MRGRAVARVLLPNDHLQFRCQWTTLRVENANTAFTGAATVGQTLRSQFLMAKGIFLRRKRSSERLEANNRVVFRYCAPDGGITKDANPNGSLNNIAGIINERGNVLGMMPHPERCCDALLGGEDGKFIFQSMIDALSARTPSGVLA